MVHSMVVHVTVVHAAVGEPLQPYMGETEGEHTIDGEMSEGVLSSLACCF